MPSLFVRFCAAVLCVNLAAAAPALAGATGPMGTVVSGASAAIKSVAQVPPVTQQPVGGTNAAGLPVGWTYTFDISVAHALGNVGSFGNTWLHGGMDAVVGYGFDSTTRLVANYYELQHYPVGFNSGSVPLYLPAGFPPAPGVNPSCVNLSGTAAGTCQGITRPIDVTTKDKFALFLLEKLFSLGKVAGQNVPVVITPTYVSRWSDVAASNNNHDVVAFVDLNGVPHLGVSTRTTQVYSIAVTLPFLRTSKMFGTFTAAPTWLVHKAGLNQENHAQLYQIFYLEYRPTPTSTIFLEPQVSRDYLPADAYAQHLAAYFLGASQRVGKLGFVQVVLNSGGPTNYSPYGVKQLNCLALPCSANTLPMVGGLKATQVQMQFGLGSPSVIQF